jgi:ferredoxin-NADP reductase
VLYTLQIDNVLRASARSRIVRIGLGNREFTFHAGQAIKIANHRDDRRRAYSITASPAEVRRAEAFELLIGVDSEGRAGPHLSLTVGTQVDVEGPLGDFILPDPADCERLVFVAGGTGIAPVRSMLRHALSGPKQITVIYSARTADDFPYGDELRALASAGRIDFRPFVTRSAPPAEWGGGIGRITTTDLEAAVQGPALYVLCGPLPMVQRVHSSLLSLGTPSHRILMEQWCRSAQSNAVVTASNLKGLCRHTACTR